MGSLVKPSAAVKKKTNTSIKELKPKSSVNNFVTALDTKSVNDSFEATTKLIMEKEAEREAIEKSAGTHPKPTTASTEIKEPLNLVRAKLTETREWSVSVKNDKVEMRKCNDAEQNICETSEKKANIVKDH